uniref:Uncharacterized protein n=1 Tax=Zea mays TaxID=4577 RepID=B7ZXV4_MAIZE|nr:unknown [Zea mays]
MLLLLLLLGATNQAANVTLHRGLVGRRASSWRPVRRRRAEVARHDAGVEQLHDGREGDAAGHLVLVDGRAAGNGVVHELLERARPDHPDLQRPDGSVRHAALSIHRVERLLHLQAAALQHVARHGLRRPLLAGLGGGQQLPVDDVVARDAAGAGVARVLHHRRAAAAARAEQRRRAVHGALQLRLVGLVGLDGQQHVLAAHEPELRRRVVEAGHAQDVADAVPVQPRVRGDHQLVLAPGLHAGQVHQLRRVAGGHAARLVHGEELEVAHVGHDGVAHLRRAAHGPEVQPEVALGGGVHCARHGEAAAVVLQGGDVLLHRAGDDHVQVPGVGPHAGDDARPVAAGALGADEARQLRVPAEHARDGVPDGRVGHARGQRPGLDVVGELLPVQLQEADGAQQARREDGAHAEHVVALAQPAHHLRVHALERVGAQDGRRGARVVVVRVERPVLEVLALVVARQHGPRRQPAGRRRLRLDEQEVERLALVQPRQVPVCVTSNYHHAIPPCEYNSLLADE